MPETIVFKSFELFFSHQLFQRLTFPNQILFRRLQIFSDPARFKIKNPPLMRPPATSGFSLKSLDLFQFLNDHLTEP